MTRKFIIIIPIVFILVGCQISEKERVYPEDVKLWHRIVGCWGSSYRIIPNNPDRLRRPLLEFEAKYPNHQLVKFGISEWIKKWSDLYWLLDFDEEVQAEILTYLEFPSLQNLQEKYNIKDKESAIKKVSKLFYAKGADLGREATKNKEDIVTYESGLLLLAIGEQDESRQEELVEGLYQKLYHIDPDGAGGIQSLASSLRNHPYIIAKDFYEEQAEGGVRRRKLDIITGLVFIEAKRDERARKLGIEMLITYTYPDLSDFNPYVPDDKRFGYDPNASEDKREEAIKKWRKWYEENKDYLYWIEDEKRPTGGYFVVDEEAKRRKTPINPRTRKLLGPEEIKQWGEEEKEHEESWRKTISE